MSTEITPAREEEEEEEEEEITPAREEEEDKEEETIAATATPATETSSSPTRAIWRSRLASAFRTSLACLIVGCITLFGPKVLQREVAYPAVSYTTTILIVSEATLSEATLGNTIAGCWYAFCATVQGAVPAFFIRWFLGTTRYTMGATVVAVTLNSFVVTLPKSTHALCKRLTFCQIVMTYAVLSVNGVRTDVFKHPIHVAASTATGALAALLAMVFPFPQLASYEIRKQCVMLNENISKRLNLFVKAFCADNTNLAIAYISQAKSLARAKTTLLKSIKIKQESMRWERFFRSSQQYMNTHDRLQKMDTPLRGIEMALSSCSSFPTNQDIKAHVPSLDDRITATLKQTLHSESLVVPETERAESLHTFFPTHNDLPSFFFLFCMKLLHIESNYSTRPNPAGTTTENNDTSKTEESVQNQDQCNKKPLFSKWPLVFKSKRLMLAVKCSLSLGLAVLFGMLFDEQNGFWSGLTIAAGISFGREAAFRVANIKAQGTVLGTIYGVISSFIFQKFLVLRLLSLLPWIVFTSFLRQSRMYSQAGAISAVVGALIISGRKNYGPTSDFAMVRITEAFIGLACSISVEFLLQPTRSSIMAKTQLSQSLRKLHGLIGSIDLRAHHKHNQFMCLKEVRRSVSELGDFIAEAEVEPNFWFLPFHTACYGMLLGSLSKMVDLIHFATHAIAFLEQRSDKLQEHTGEDVDQFKNLVVSALKCFEEITLIKSLEALEKDLKKKKNISLDLEFGKSLTNEYGFKVLSSGDYEDEMEKIMNLFVQHSREMVDGFEREEDEDEMKIHSVVCLSALGFCMDGLMKETKTMEKRVQELVQWENPSSYDREKKKRDKTEEELREEERRFKKERDREKKKRDKMEEELREEERRFKKERAQKFLDSTIDNHIEIEEKMKTKSMSKRRALKEKQRCVGID